MAKARRTSKRGSATDGVVRVINPEGGGDIVLACEHASNVIPAEFGNLELPDGAFDSHVAWDPGALEVARQMARLLDAPLVASCVSRLVYDCNRPPEAPSAIPVESERLEIPGNVGLSDDERRERAERYYAPFRAALTATIDARITRPRPPVLLTVHSFTRIYDGVRRDVELGIVHDADPRFADALLTVAETEAALVVRRNEPYGPEDGVTHTLATQAVARGLPNAMLEIRNDLIRSSDAQRAMAVRLARYALEALSHQPSEGAAGGASRTSRKPPAAAGTSH